MSEVQVPVPEDLVWAKEDDDCIECKAHLVRDKPAPAEDLVWIQWESNGKLSCLPKFLVRKMVEPSPTSKKKTKSRPGGIAPPEPSSKKACRSFIELPPKAAPREPKVLLHPPPLPPTVQSIEPPLVTSAVDAKKLPLPPVALPKKAAPKRPRKDLVDKSRWDRMLDRFVAYYQHTGHVRVSRRDHDLHQWVSWQRFLYKEHRLSSERIKKLQLAGVLAVTSSIDMEQECNSDDSHLTWDDLYATLKNLYLQAGHCLVSKRNDPVLYNWVQTQKRALDSYQFENGASPLVAQRVQQLAELGLQGQDSESDSSDESKELGTVPVANGYYLRHRPVDFFGPPPKRYVPAGDSLFFGRFAHIPRKIQLTPADATIYESRYATMDQLTRV